MDNIFQDEVFKDLNYTSVTFSSKKFIDCSFVNCKFNTVEIKTLSFINCSFTNSDIVNLISDLSEIKNCEFHNCNIIGLHWRELSLSKVMRPISYFKDNFIKYNTFVMMDLKKVDFSNNTMVACIFDDCNLSEAKFNGVQFENTEFIFNNLSFANFKEATGYHIDITNNKLQGAKFSFPEVINLLESLKIEID